MPTAPRAMFPRRPAGPVLRASLSGLVALAAGCASTTPEGPVPPGVIRTSLPPVPTVTGPLALRVEYPDSLQLIVVADSNFLHGTTGTGDATLIIDGAIVDVEPNGAFLAWLPVPAAERGDTAYYRLVARRGSEIDTLLHPILRPPSPPDEEWGAGRLLDPGSTGERRERWAVPDEPITLEVRAAPDAEVELVAGRTTLPMETGPRPDTRVVTLAAEELYRAACVPEDCNWRREPDRLRMEVRARRAEEVQREPLVLPLRILDPVRLPVVELRDAPDAVSGNDGMVVARPASTGPYRWRFPAGTRAEVDGRVGDRLRLRLVPGLHAWVLAEDAGSLPEGSSVSRATVGDLRFVSRADATELALPLSAPLPLAVEQPDARTLELVLFGVTGLTNRVSLGAAPRLVSSATWSQEPGPIWRLRIRLGAPVWGWRARYAPTAAGSATLRFELRGPPAIESGAPLRGRRIAIDPGHPGAGATGPTGFYEGDANLAIGRILARLLAERGAVPILLRDDTLPMGLYERTTAAEEAGAELFVSIHNNALPDGVRPFGREGTSTYWYHPHAAALADAVQDGMLATMRLRDLGTFWGDLAVCRMSWMPSILTEGAFMMMPRHEAALRDPGFQELYARGIADGLERFLRETAGEER